MGFIDWLKSRWEAPWLVPGAAVVAFLGLVGFFGQADVQEVEPHEWLVATGITIVIVLTLVWIRRMPKVGVGKVGFGLAIACETDEHRSQLQADFVRALERLATGDRFKYTTEVLEFAPRFARRAQSVDGARKLLHGANLRFLIWGRARKRGDVHVLDLDASVRHGAIKNDVSKKFGAEMRAVLPARVKLPERNDFEGFEVTAELVNVAAQYMVGVAALLTGDFEYAEELLLETERQLGKWGRGIAGVDRIRERLPQRFAELYSAWTEFLSRRYQVEREPRYLERCEQVAEKWQRYGGETYLVLTTKAMAAFELRGSVAEARKWLRRCKHEKDATWRYGVAFLDAYDGKAMSAYREYMRAFRAPLDDPRVPMKAEEFVHRVLEREPDRKLLHLALGLINHRGKHDLRAARRDYKKFLEEAAEDEFQEVRTFAEKWIEEIDAELGKLGE